ncbi:putative zinc finger protein [Actinomadura pelletieri DSM 43383]|uniref:Putative zinc finger protein n=1 Tax=Actinomadura pelletieri DSM 43383 TaxID=1120940 RepID=A0A495QIB3_9ACTN|nr:zf-HC2 domain-containing protein [Actinomadura pelletieri]RKS71877.1 putative zinc finger protein [Actinomadura pelletieri DSM 43383]
MSCLGERLTALVDGELGHEERDRALAHLACCDRCRSEVASLRMLKGRLRELSEHPLRDDGADDLPSGDFLSRLLSMPTSAASSASGDVVTEPAAGPLGSAPAPDSPWPPRSPVRQARPARPLRSSPVARPRDTRPAGRAVALQVQPRRRYLVMGAATLFLGLGAASYAVGGDDAPTISPAFDKHAVQHALTSGDAPVTDPLTDPVNQVQVSPGP